MRPEASAEAIRPREAQVPEGEAVATEPPSRAPIHADVIIAGVILAVCALVWAVTAGFEEVPAALLSGMGPAVFPRIVLVVIAALALWLALSSRGRPDPVREPIPGLVFVTGGAVLAFMGVLKLLGVYGAILFAVIGIGRLWGERRWWLLAAVAAGMIVAIHLAFAVAFGIPLPRGIAASWLS
jgi:tripartite tricarboxylate transporter TctB family protein